MQSSCGIFSQAYTLLGALKGPWRFIVTIVQLCSTPTIIWVLKNQNLLISSILLWKKEFMREKKLIEHIGMDLMLADPLTKGLTLKAFHGHVVHMSLGFEIAFD